MMIRMHTVHSKGLASRDCLLRALYYSASIHARPQVFLFNFLVNRVIQKAMANPVPPLRPQLPEFLLVARKLQQHVLVLKPFLDSFPPPFTWRIETRCVVSN